MLEIRTSHINLDELKAKHYKSLLASPFNIEKSIVDKKNYYRGIGNDIYGDLYEYFEIRLKPILIGSPEDLSEIIRELSPLYFAIIEQIKCKNSLQETRTKKLKEFADEIYGIFDYDKFSKRYGKYGAYELVLELNVNVCPYCNRNYTNTVMFDGGKSRARLDHWFSKSKYPFLSLSLFNLIPSCHICNSDMKGSEDFYLESHIHPYIADYKNKLLFKSNYNDASYASGDLNAITITMEPADGLRDDDPEIYKSKNNVKAFGIVELYSWHKNEAAKIIRQSKKLTLHNIEYYRKLKFDDGSLLYNSDDEVYENEYGVIFNSKNFHDTPLSKFRRDIAYELGMIKVIQ